MRKILGITGLLVAIVAFTAANSPNFATNYNLQNVVTWSSLYAIISIGVAFVIITGGIDLSIGAVIGLSGSLLPYLLTEKGFGIPAAIMTVIAMSAAIGILHGLLITKLRLQPFIVTLCGLMVYRGIARWFTKDATQGFGSNFDPLRQLVKGRLDLHLPGGFEVPMPFLLLVVLTILASIYLNLTVYGRYTLAVGRNEQAARFSGINTHRVIIVAYLICAVMAGFGGILLSLEVNTVQPASFGEFYELYAIAAAVLGGCSLRGGEGTIVGVAVGAAVMRFLNNSIGLLNISSQLEYAIIGSVILAGAIADELIHRVTLRHRTRRAFVPD